MPHEKHINSKQIQRVSNCPPLRFLDEHISGPCIGAAVDKEVARALSLLATCMHDTCNGGSVKYIYIARLRQHKLQCTSQINIVRFNYVSGTKRHCNDVIFTQVDNPSPRELCFPSFLNPRLPQMANLLAEAHIYVLYM